MKCGITLIGHTAPPEFFKLTTVLKEEASLRQKFYHDPLRPELCCPIIFGTKNHKLASAAFKKSLYFVERLFLSVKFELLFKTTDKRQFDGKKDDF